jgi:peptidoglycan/LPS O-acetylase OafA/YrhL
MTGRLERLERPLLVSFCVLFTLLSAYIFLDGISHCAATGRWYDFYAVTRVLALPLGFEVFLIPALRRLLPSMRRLLDASGIALAATALLLVLAASRAGGLSREFAAGLALGLAASLVISLYMFIAQPKQPPAGRPRSATPAAWAPRQPTDEEIYERLLDAYVRAWGGPPERARARLEADIKKLVEQGLSREEAVKRLYR